MSLVRRGLSCKWCDSSDAMSEYADNYYCFSCKRSERKELTTKSWLGSTKKSIVQNVAELPQNVADFLPIDVKAWLYSYHFTDQLIDKYRICYTPNLQVQKEWGVVEYGPRCILPYYERGELKTYEARRMDDSYKCKYITIGTKSLLFPSKSVKLNNKTICLVEDMLSAMRVGEICPTIALRGTGLSLKQWKQLLPLADNFIVWLDSDVPGQKAARKINTKLNLSSNSVILKTDKDPKCYSNQKIHTLLTTLLKSDLPK